MRSAKEIFPTKEEREEVKEMLDAVNGKVTRVWDEKNNLIFTCNRCINV